MQNSKSDTNPFLSPKPIKLWLDDIRIAPFEYNVHVRTVPHAILLLQTGLVESVSLDHDLGIDEPTGYDLVKWIEEKAYYGLIPRIAWKIHSANPVGVEQMRLGLENADRYWNG